MVLVRTIISNITNDGGFCINHYKASDNSNVLVAIVTNKDGLNDKLLNEISEVMSNCINETNSIMKTNPICLLQ